MAAILRGIAEILRKQSTSLSIGKWLMELDELSLTFPLIFILVAVHEELKSNEKRRERKMKCC